MTATRLAVLASAAAGAAAAATTAAANIHRKARPRPKSAKNPNGWPAIVIFFLFFFRFFGCAAEGVS
jgi:hypothetical protein